MSALRAGFEFPDLLAYGKQVDVVYIALQMNSDVVPYECFGKGFDIREHIMKTKLTDETEAGELFGIRF